eukprot:1563419-Lingulodinium_polyedra.AAC.1
MEERQRKQLSAPIEDFAPANSGCFACAPPKGGVGQFSRHGQPRPRVLPGLCGAIAPPPTPGSLQG